MNEIPLIYTIKGNLPIDDLTRRDGWDFDGTGISYWEEYLLNDEIVRRSVSRFQYPPDNLQENQGNLI